MPRRGAGSKTAPREGGQGVGGARLEMRQDTVSGVPDTATQGTDARDQQWRWAEASIWTERMVSALVNGVKGGKWYSLVDKAIRPTTLDAAWHKVARNKGAAGVDGQSIERFAAQADRYLQELHDSLKDGTTGRARSNGWRSPKATGGPVRWGSRRSRTGSCRRLSR